MIMQLRDWGDDLCQERIEMPPDKGNIIVRREKTRGRSKHTRGYRRLLSKWNLKNGEKGRRREKAMKVKYYVGHQGGK